MNLGLVTALLLLVGSSAMAQTTPTLDRNCRDRNLTPVVCPADVAKAIATRANHTNGVLTTPTINGGTVSGTTLSAGNVTVNGVTQQLSAWLGGSGSVSPDSTIITRDGRTRRVQDAFWVNEYAYLLAPQGWPLEVCPVANCPVPGSTGYGGAYGGPTLSGFSLRGQSTPQKNPQFLSTIGLYVDDDGTKLGQYVAQYIGAMQGPNAGPTWSLNTDIVRGACGGGTYSFGGEPGSGIPFGDAGCSAAPGSLGQVATYGYEMDVNNLEGDTDVTGATVQGLFINVTHSRYTSGDGIFLSADPNMGVAAWHNGLTFGNRSVKDRSVFDYSGSASGWVSGGNHSNASFWDVATGRFSIRIEGTKTEADISSTSTSPALLANTGNKSAGVIVETSNSATVISTAGSHGNATFDDKSTTPAALSLSGNYSVAAIYTGNATTLAAIITKPGQQTCLGGGGVACFVYNAGTGKVYLTTNGVNLWSIDANGKQITRGGSVQGEP